MAAESEKIYECQVKRRRLKIGGGYEPFWKLKSVTEAHRRRRYRIPLFRLHGRGQDPPSPHPGFTAAAHRTQTQERLRILPPRVSSSEKPPTAARLACPNTRYAKAHCQAGGRSDLDRHHLMIEKLKTS